MRHIILDTETTGLDPQQGHRIIEIGCVELINRSFSGNDFHTYINPERAIDKGAQKVHGITREFLQDKPVFKDIVEAFLVYIKGAELIIHNAPFDLGFLNHELATYNKKLHKVQEYCQIIDTLKMAREKYPGQKNNLDALCKRHEVDNSDRNLHGALLDAKLLARVYLAMTGGQVSLFQVEAAIAESTRQQPASVTREGLTIPIIPADPAELKAHGEYLEYLRAQSGKSLWEE